MRKSLLLSSAIAISLLAGAASAATVNDPVGDFLTSYTGPRTGDFDVTSFGVTYDAASKMFTVSATMDGAINTNPGGFYAIGVDTGTGPAKPFGAIGEGNVIFNTVISVQKNGTATVGAAALAPGAVTISGNSFSVDVPLALLPSTGFTPGDYGFNLWPRSGAGGTEVISDFAPENALLAPGAAAAVPEMATWMELICGFALMGAAVRRRKGGSVPVSAA